MNILFYFPTNKASVSLESLMESFKLKGHNVFLLGHEGKGVIHKNVEKFGVKTDNYKISKKFSILYYLKHLIYLIKYIKINDIDIVYSHTQVVNIIAVFAQYFVKARIIICRHHSDSMVINDNFFGILFDKIINRLGKEFIVPSKKVFYQMVTNEKVNKDKIRLINYGYNFSFYTKPDQNRIETIKEKYSAELLIVTVARFIKNKRHIILFKVINDLVKQGYNIKLLALSEGPLKEDLNNYIKNKNLQEKIFILGYKTNVIDYLKAANVIVHISNSEASNSLIKEAGLVKKPVVVCKDVGDFDDYITNNINGFVIQKESPEKELKELIVKIYKNRKILDLLGNNLHKKVIETFSIDNVVEKYTEINNINLI